MWVPVARPVTFCVPLATALAMPGPLTKTEVALAVLHEIVVAPGAVAEVGLALIEPETVGTAALTVNVAVRVIGPPGPCAVSLNVCVPAVRPVRFWLPVVAVLLRPGPETETEVALVVLHAMAVEAGSVPVAGLAVIEPETETAEVTVNVAVCVAGPLVPCAVMT